MKKLLVFTAIITLISCETQLEIELPPQESKLVLNEVLYSDSTLKAEVSKSISILENEFDLSVTGATVNLYENEVLMGQMQEAPNEPGKYFSNVIPSTNNYYKITVAKDSYETIEGSTFFHEASPITQVESSLQPSYNDPFGGEYNYRRFNVTFSDPATEVNFYNISVYTKSCYIDINGDSTCSFYRSSIEAVYDPVLNAASNDFTYYDFGIPFDDSYFNGNNYTLSFDVWAEVYDGEEFAGSDSTYYIVLGTTDEAFYNYNKSISAYNFANGNPFAEPVQVYSNIQNGFGVLGSNSEYAYPYKLD